MGRDDYDVSESKFSDDCYQRTQLPSLPNAPLSRHAFLNAVFSLSARCLEGDLFLALLEVRELGVSCRHFMVVARESSERAIGWCPCWH